MLTYMDPSPFWLKTSWFKAKSARCSSKVMVQKETIRHPEEQAAPRHPAASQFEEESAEAPAALKRPAASQSGRDSAEALAALKRPAAKSARCSHKVAVAKETSRNAEEPPAPRHIAWSQFEEESAEAPAELKRPAPSQSEGDGAEAVENDAGQNPNELAPAALKRPAASQSEGDGAEALAARKRPATTAGSPEQRMQVNPFLGYGLQPQEAQRLYELDQRGPSGGYWAKGNPDRCKFHFEDNP